MELLNSGFNACEKIAENPQVRRYVTSYRKRYKDAGLWTVDTGCIVFTSFIIYYLNFLSSREGNTMDRIVTFLFVLGVLAYVGLSSFFRKLNKMSEDNMILQFLKTGNTYVYVTCAHVTYVTITHIHNYIYNTK